MHINKERGNTAELRAALDLAKNGASIFKEMGESSRVDLIAEISGRLIKVQVKSVCKQNGAYRFSTRKTTTRYVYNYTSKDVDLFAVHCVDDDVVVWIVARDWISSEMSSSVHCSFRPDGVATKNNQVKGVRKISDFSDLTRALDRFFSEDHGS